MKKYFGALVVALVASMSFAGVAAAADSEEPADSTLLTPQVIVDEESGTIYVGLPSEGEAPECGPEDPDDREASGDSDAEEPEDGEATTYGPGDCIEIVIDHPSGKTHHGAIVSTVAKNLHPSMLDGIKKGEIMRYVAKAGKVVDGDGETEGEAKVKADKPAKVKKDKPEKVKKDKKDKANKGRDRVKTNNGRHNR